MGLCIGYQSALRYWLTKTDGEEAPGCATIGAFRQAEASAALVKEGTLPFAAEEDRPLHLAVHDPRLRHRVRNAQVHVYATEPAAGSFCQLPNGNLVASPELTFLQMAVGSSLWRAVEVGNYLTSTFAVADSGRGYAGRRAQLVSAARVSEYLEELPPHTYGLARAKQAIKYVVEMTASPMESQLAMHYVLPPDLGGRGPMQMVANQVIQIEEHGQRLLGSAYLVGDLYLPEFSCDLEFDSREYHTGAFRLDHTQARRNVLEAMQVKTVSATSGQIGTIRSFDDFTWLLEERIGREHPTYTREQRSAQMELFAWLTDWRRTLF